MSAERKRRKPRSSFTRSRGWANCLDCPWAISGKAGAAAIAAAAGHHDATGHTTQAEQTIQVQYGRKP